MPKLDLDTGRPASRRVESDDLVTQGHGSWVEFRQRLSMKHIRSVAEMATWQNASFQENPAEVLTMLGRFGEILSELVIAWNWTNEEGKALPHPKANPDAFDELTIEELTWLIEAMSEHLGKVGPRGN